MAIMRCHVPNRLCSQPNHTGNPRRAKAFGQVQPRQGAQDDLHLLNPAAENPGEFLIILRCNFDTERWTAHSQSVDQNNSI